MPGIKRENGAMRNARNILSAAILTVAAVGQIILSFLLYNDSGNPTVTNIGWVLLWISAVFGWLPILTLRKWGKVPKGKAYVHTTVLVERGVYAIVRHPQYLAGILMGIALALIAQHWIVAIFGAVVVLVTYTGTFEEESSCMEKFGQDYERYRERVPRVNFVFGIVRLLMRKSS
jgi:protein-S-isoprenylcysteine O-methyltransferase Ste14